VLDGEAAVRLYQEVGHFRVGVNRAGENDIVAGGEPFESRGDVHRGADVVEPVVKGDGDARSEVRASFEAQGNGPCWWRSEDRLCVDDGAKRVRWGIACVANEGSGFRLNLPGNSCMCSLPAPLASSVYGWLTGAWPPSLRPADRGSVVRR